jgi:hypothetical protein
MVDRGERLETSLMLLLGVTVRERAESFNMETLASWSEEDSDGMHIAESACDMPVFGGLATCSRWIHSSAHPRVFNGLTVNTSGSKGVIGLSGGYAPDIEVDFGNGFLLIGGLQRRGLDFFSLTEPMTSDDTGDILWAIISSPNELARYVTPLANGAGDWNGLSHDPRAVNTTPVATL